MIGLATAVCVIVFGALLVALRVAPQPGVRERGDQPGESDSSEDGAATRSRERAERMVVVLGMILPAALLVFTFGYTVHTLREATGVAGSGGATSFAAHADHPEYRPDYGQSAALRSAAAYVPVVPIAVTGHQWWWQIDYPAAGVVTANEIHLPAGAPVQLSLTSRDVIHSFWVPQVTGKVDLVPGKVNTLTVLVEQTGIFRGLCSEFCGLQHAQMHMRFVVQPPDEFAAWLAAQQQAPLPPATPAAQAGQEVFWARCAECHTVQGVADGTRGPNLTHLASRMTLGAGIHENTRENLAGWTRNPQAMKPGNRMPSVPLTDDELAALLAYLEGLR